MREPITLFGEGPADRRERLRELIAAMEEAGIKVKPTNRETISGGDDEVCVLRMCYLFLSAIKACRQERRHMYIIGGGG